LHSKGFPQLIHQGISVDEEFIYFASDLLGPSIEDLYSLCNEKFSLKTTLMLFYQLLERLEHMHKLQVIHRDLKPDNIMMGLGDASNTVHLIDFGLTRSIIDSETGKHIPLVTGKSLIGTCRYVSANSHNGLELSRRDDLITLGYVMIRLFRGSLPWQSVSIQDRELR
jgi:casein kinase 1